MHNEEGLEEYLVVFRSKEQERNRKVAAAVGGRVEGELNTSEPQIFLSGSPVTSQDECLPYLLAQHTPPFLKSYARIHTFPGKVCPVNAIRRGKGYVRVSVDTPDLKREGPLNVKVGKERVS